jgi:hypothetical protein
MRMKILSIALVLVVGSRTAWAQASRSPRTVAVIESIHGDSAGRAIRHGRLLNPAALDSLLVSLKNTVGATIWFSWSGGPKKARTQEQDRLLTHLRAPGIRVELRTDSTLYSRVVRP